MGSSRHHRACPGGAMIDQLRRGARPPVRFSAAAARSGGPGGGCGKPEICGDACVSSSVIVPPTWGRWGHSQFVRFGLSAIRCGTTYYMKSSRKTRGTADLKSACACHKMTSIATFSTAGALAMVLYHGKRIESALVGGRIVAVRCDKCACEYFYELARIGTGASTAHYGIGQAAAAQSSQQKSQRDLNERLARGRTGAVPEVQLDQRGTDSWISTRTASARR